MQLTICRSGLQNPLVIAYDVAGLNTSRLAKAVASQPVSLFQPKRFTGLWQGAAWAAGLRLLHGFPLVGLFLWGRLGDGFGDRLELFTTSSMPTPALPSCVEVVRHQLEPLKQPSADLVVCSSPFWGVDVPGWRFYYPCTASCIARGGVISLEGGATHYYQLLSSNGVKRDGKRNI